MKKVQVGILVWIHLTNILMECSNASTSFMKDQKLARSQIKNSSFFCTFFCVKLTIAFLKYKNRYFTVISWCRNFVERQFARNSNKTKWIYTLLQRFKTLPLGQLQIKIPGLLKIIKVLIKLSANNCVFKILWLLRLPSFINTSLTGYQIIYYPQKPLIWRNRCVFLTVNCHR